MERKRVAVIIVSVVLIIASFLFFNAEVLAFSRTLKIGNQGKDVAELQEMLSKLGFYHSKIDGIYGHITQKAVMNFQRSMGLFPDGVFGKNTIAALNSIIYDASVKRKVMGFAAEDYNGDNRSYYSLLKNSKTLDSVATFSYGLTYSGDLTGTTPYKTIKTAWEKGVKPLVLIHNFNNNQFDKFTAEAVLKSYAKRKRLINNILWIIERDGYAGVNIDIEGISFKNKWNYISFLWELRSALRLKGLELSVSVPAKTWDDPYNGWSGGYDYKQIGQVADFVVIMAYDEHWSGGNPGPTASIQWVKSVINYAVSRIPREKILLGIGAYGYDWSHYKTTNMVPLNQINDLIRINNGWLAWHDYFQQPYYIYWKNGKKHQVWFENEHSVKLKLQLVESYNLGGIAIWRLGFETTAYWQTIKNTLS
ncbi:MAG: spore germination protein [Thermosediminibacterales bacterium]|nr:spore germination protein [Thermosediminibacterales bacterium]MDK2835762.1 spore germination protein [Thermosediminibacterales bacterium]